jgi:hypothetical protein
MSELNKELDAMRHSVLESLGTLNEWSTRITGWIRRSEKVLPKGSPAVLLSYVKMVDDHVAMIRAYVNLEAAVKGDTVAITNSKGGSV